MNTIMWSCIFYSLKNYTATHLALMTGWLGINYNYNNKTQKVLPQHYRWSLIYDLMTIITMDWKEIMTHLRIYDILELMTAEPPLKSHNHILDAWQLAGICDWLQYPTVTWTHFVMFLPETGKATHWIKADSHLWSYDSLKNEVHLLNACCKNGCKIEYGHVPQFMTATYN